MADISMYREVIALGAVAALVLMLIGFRKYVKEDIWQSKKFRLSGGVLLIAAGIIINLACIGGMMVEKRSAENILPTQPPVQSELSENKPRDMIEVPDVTGMEQREAVVLLMDRGLTFEVWWTMENDVDANRRYIASQSIPAGSQVPEGTMIKLELYVKEEDKLIGEDEQSEEPSLFTWYNTDPQQGVQIPDVVGMEQTEAADQLVSCGLDFQIWWTGTEEEASDTYYVIYQSVPAKSFAPAGTKIDLWLSVHKPEK